jgi:hypothetical protein
MRLIRTTSLPGIERMAGMWKEVEYLTKVQDIERTIETLKPHELAELYS